MKSILVIENNLYCQRQICREVEAQGWRSLTAPHGLIGLDLAREHQPEVVLCGDKNPILSGLETIAALRKDLATATIPCFLMTTEVDVDYYFSALNVGVDGFLKKPINFNDLWRILQSKGLKTA